jgi:hypothetical protein
MNKEKPKNINITQKKIGIIAIIATILCLVVSTIASRCNTQLQIDAMRETEESKRSNAIKSLINEILRNRGWVNDIINFKEKGSLGGKKLNETKEQHSWTDNSPQFSAYNKNFPGIGDSLEPVDVTTIVNLYITLEQCKAILDRTQEPVNKEEWEKIDENYNEIYRICLSINNDFDIKDLIEKLKSKINMNNSDNTGIIDPSGLKMSGTEVGENFLNRKK